MPREVKLGEPNGAAVENHLERVCGGNRKTDFLLTGWTLQLQLARGNRKHKHWREYVKFMAGIVPLVASSGREKLLNIKTLSRSRCLYRKCSSVLKSEAAD